MKNAHLKQKKSQLEDDYNRIIGYAYVQDIEADVKNLHFLPILARLLIISININ